MNNNEVSHPLLKASSVGAAWLGGMTWGEVASMLASAYTLLLIIDWWWKRFGKALFQRLGVIKGRRRDWMDTTGDMPFDEKTP